MYINRLIREDRDRQIELVSQGKEYSAVENEISNVEVLTVSLFILYYSLFFKEASRNNAILKF